MRQGEARLGVPKPGTDEGEAVWRRYVAGTMGLRRRRNPWLRVGVVLATGVVMLWLWGMR